MGRQIILFVLCCICSAKGLFANEHCKALFSGQDELIERLVSDIKSEKYLIQIAASRVTNRKVINALIAAKRKGIVVEVILDDMKDRPSSSVRDLFKNNVPVFVYRPKHYFKKPHILHKFCVLSDKVWMGNFVINRARKATLRESAVVISHKDVVEDFMREFEYLKHTECKRAIL